MRSKSVSGAMISCFCVPSVAEQSHAWFVPVTSMSTVYITRRAHFNAAHRLHNPARSEAWNRATFGPCNNANWHGHNYLLEVTVAGTPAQDTGYVLDLSQLQQIMQAHVVDHLDHKNLNLDVAFLEGIMPSTENVVVAIWNALEPHIPAGRLHRVRLFETERNYAEYYGPVHDQH